MANFRAIEPSHLARISPNDFAASHCSQPAVREALTEALLERVQGLEEAVATAERLPLVVGTRFDPACHTLRDFLSRTFVESDWLDPTNDDERACIPSDALAYNSFPLLILPDGSVLCRPSLREVAAAVGEGSMAIAFIHQYLASQNGHG
jgi:thioredoxin reductase (NADPH)